ncbi:MAG: pyridoxamine 5'-phosphate oxidase family protein [Mycobacterium sp.]|nr:pyridoxamine 5'-phosphate oxidase family protein [Mycobacterium sp.]
MVPVTLTPGDLEFLRRPLYGFFTVATGADPPQPRPVWFEATEHGTIELFTLTDAVKVRRLRTDPRASLVVAAPVRERERWVSVAGATTLESQGAQQLATRLADRYWDLTDEAQSAALQGMLGADLLRVVIHPDKVTRYTP